LTIFNYPLKIIHF